MATITVAMETMDNNFSGSQNPKANNAYDLGTSALHWRTLFTENIAINGEVVPVNKIPYVGSSTVDPLLKSGGNMTGDINWTETGKGLAWGMNTDGAGIRFNNTGDGDTNSYLEFYTYDNEDERFKWTHRSSLTNQYQVWMELFNNGLKVNGSWVYTEGWKPTPEAIGAIRAGNWATNGGQDLLVHNKRALVGFTSGELHLGYGGDFHTIKCGADYTIWHTGNLNNTSDFSLRNLSLGNAYITMGGRILSIQYAEPTGSPDGTIWIK